MSHFSTIKTKFKDHDALLKALEVLQYDVTVEQKLKNPIDHNHEELHVQVAVGNDIGFRFNETSRAYELVTDLQTWDRPIPVERFLQKVSQQYAEEVITAQALKDGMQIESRKVDVDGSVELTVSSWG
tara:strand:- start:310 stop:693 length:384 start_codon:yes stop_codon:yes gene_type:complete